MKLNKGLALTNLEQAKALYKEAFNDSDQFIDLYFSQYAKNNDYYFIDQDGQLIFACCNNIKRLYLDNKKHSVAFIVAVSTKKEYQGKGIMRSVFQRWLDHLYINYEYVFIQAYNWNVYKAYDFHVCTYKNIYQLKDDQYLKPIEYSSEINYSKLTEIQNNFLRFNKIKNFTYKTTKENQLYYKMLKNAGDTIIMTNDAYIVFDSNKTVYDFAFLDLKNFIRLLSNFKENPLKLKSYLLLDKRFFKLLEEKVIDAKVYKHKDLDIYFNETF